MNSPRNLAVSLAVSIAAHGLVALGVAGLVMVGVSEIVPVFRQGFSGIMVSLVESAQSEAGTALTAEIKKDADLPVIVKNAAKPEEPAVVEQVNAVVPVTRPPEADTAKTEEPAVIEQVNAVVPATRQPEAAAAMLEEYAAEFDNGVEKYLNNKVTEMMPESATGKNSGDSSGGDRMDNGVQPSADMEVLADVHPVYPKGARLRGEEGVVVLKITVNKVGRADKVEVLKSSGYSSLDGSAVDALKKARFMVRNGGAMNGGEVTLPFRFKLVN